MHAQLYLTQDWVHTTGIPDTVDYSASCADGSGNIYVTTNTLTDTEGANILTTKYNSSGGVVWEVEKDHADGNDYGSAVTVDASGNVYVAAAAWTSAGNYYDYLIIKYNSSGTQQWTATYNGPGSFYDVPTDIFVDGSGNVYVTGASYGSGTLSDFCTIKYNSSGTQQWASRYNYASDQDIAAVLKESPSGRIITIGASASSPGDYDFALIKYNQNTGAQISATRNSASGVGFDQVYGADVDVSGNILLTGRAAVTDKGYDIRTVKLDTALNVTWSKNFDLDSLDDEGHGLLTDESGNVYVTGWVTNAPGNRSMVTIKYNSAGTKQWHKKEDAVNAGLDAMGLKISRHNTGPIAVAGNLDNGASVDYLLVLYDDAGERLWIEQYDSPQKHDDKVNFVKADAGDTYYVGGKSYGVSTATNRLIKYSAHKLVIPPDDDMEHPSAFTFFENKGQLIDTEDSLRPDIQYYTHRTGPSLYFMDDTLSYVWSRIDTSTSTQDTLARVDLSFTGSNSGKTIHHAVSEGGEYLNYYLAHCATGVTQVRSSDRLVAEELYDHVDLQYYFDGAGLKYYLLIKPGYSAQNDPIVMQYTGAESVTILTGNKLEVSSVLGSFTLRSPEAYQIDTDGSRIDLAWDATFTDEGGDAVGLDLDTYDDELVLVIEIGVSSEISELLTDDNVYWSTIFDDTDPSSIYDITYSRAGNPMILCNTESLIFPIDPVTLFEEPFLGIDDILIYSFNENRNLVWGAVVGGSDGDYPTEMDMNTESGSIIVVGTTCSNDFFTHNAYGDGYYLGEFTNANDYQGIIFAISPEGTSIEWSTYVEGLTHIYDVDFNKYNDEFSIVGATDLDESSVALQGMPGAFFENGTTESANSYIATFTPDYEMIWGSLYWSSRATCVLYDELNRLNIAGEMHNNHYFEAIGLDLDEGTIGEIFELTEDETSIYFTTFDVNKSVLWATPYGGSGDESVTGIATNLSTSSVMFVGNSAPIEGTTSFTWPVYTIYTEPESYYREEYTDALPSENSYDGFIVKFNLQRELQVSSLFGGEASDAIREVASDGSNYWIVGTTSSGSSTSFPKVERLGFFNAQTDMNDDALLYPRNAFVTIVDELMQISYSSWIGGLITSEARDVCIDRINNSVAMSGLANFDSYEGSAFSPLAKPFDDSYYKTYNLNAPIGARLSFVSEWEINVETYISETNNPFCISVFPNPTSDRINISSNHVFDIESVRIYSILGHEVLNLNNYSSQIDVRALSPGFYIIIINGNNYSWKNAIIKL